ncbi:hypothetical protein EDD11_004270 [Mortierella claussenii]|nr:hypothetical protein EDD11_004270 [Mortierella claussenii]
MAAITHPSSSGVLGFAASDPTVGSPSYHDDADRFLGRRAVRDTWIALWVLWALWAMLFLLRQLLGHHRYNGLRGDRVVSSDAVAPDVGPYDAAAVPGRTAATSAVGVEPVAVGGARPVGTQKTFFGRSADNFRDRVDRTHNLVRDLTLMLLLAVTLNTLGRGSGVFVLIVAWIYVAFAYLWAGIIMMVENRILDFILGGLEMLLILAMLIAAYAVGWWLF